MKTNQVVVTFVCAVAGLLFSGCGPDCLSLRYGTSPGFRSEAPRFETGTARQVSCAEMESLIQDRLVERMKRETAWSAENYTACGGGDSFRGAMPMAKGADGSPGGRLHSGTNNQVAGVEEMDRVKTDGQWLYVADGNLVHISTIAPLSEAKLVTSIALTQGYEAAGLLLHEELKSLIVISQPKWSECIDYCATWDFSARDSEIRIYDVVDPATPQLKVREKIPGVLDARRVDGDLVLISSGEIAFPEGVELNATEERLERIQSFNQELIRTSSVAELAECSDAVILPSGDTLWNLTRMSLLTGERHPTHIYGAADVTHVSREAIFLARRAYSRHQTEVHAFAGPELAYQGSGITTGYVTDTFSMDSYDGMLRLAVTGSFGSRVVVLSPAPEDSDRLEVLGGTPWVAPGEWLFASRFSGDQAFLVTFRQVDPLYTIDLSNPADPQVSGELKVPGFSTYLHVIDSTRILGIGRDGGLKLSLFDVSSFSAPTELSTWTSPGWSEAGLDHHAFTYFPLFGRALVPHSSSSENSQSLEIFELGDGQDIAHAASLPLDGLNESATGWMRGIHTAEGVVAVSRKGFRASHAADPGRPVVTVAFPR